ncbi:MAG: ABC transporter ATP-binding protein, partial [Gammaproteobacteria bacterium]|nr:ABC transporter ATP-binding protein [Gammaproteobacteria bacterium]
MQTPDQISWAHIRRLAVQHKPSLIVANILALLATLCSVPIPLLLPLLVDEVLLGQSGKALETMDRWLPG